MSKNWGLGHLDRNGKDVGRSLEIGMEMLVWEWELGMLSRSTLVLGQRTATVQCPSSSLYYFGHFNNPGLID